MYCTYCMTCIRVQQEELSAQEGAAERVAALARELRAAHVGLPDSAGAALGAWGRAQARLQPAAVRMPGPARPPPCIPTHRCVSQGADSRGGEFVTRVNACRASVAAAASALRQHPLGGRDYDDFPMQEDALAVTSITLHHINTSASKEVRISRLNLIV